MTARTISHYRIERRLGAGGMGEVYLAHDLALGRPAALKVLPPGFSFELRARLLREAEASARLQHPCIATFYEAGEAGGEAFIAMEYVEGRTVRDRLAEGPAAPAEALAVAACVLEALGHAHGAGLLHRDIKPENVMLLDRPGQAKLLDFGIARQLAPEIGTDAPTVSGGLTGAHVTIGTAGYMSPEQLRGESLDASSDLFAVGALLYEMLSGRAAFGGASTAERIAATLTRDPPPLQGPGLPAELNAVLRRALGRQRQQRYPSAAAFLSDLRRLDLAQPEGATGGTVAVIDLQNLSGRTEDDWIGSGIAESLAADLSRLPGIQVAAREKVLRRAAGAPGGRPDALGIGLALGCRWVLSGSYQRLGSRLRVTARLAEVATGRVLSSEKIDGALDDIFEMEDRLAAAAAASLNLRIPTADERGAAAPALDAYECYARARRLLLRLEKGTFDEARALYEQAVAAEPAYAAAHAGLAAVHALRFTFTTDPAVLTESADSARRAIAADPALGEPHVWLGYVLMRQGRYEDAVESEQRAMALDPASHFAPYFAACALYFGGRRAEAVPVFQRAVEMEPQYGWSWLGLGWCHLDLERRREAEWCLERAVAVELGGAAGPTAGVTGYLGECLRRQGRLAEARQRCLEGLAAVERSDHMYRDTFRGVCLCALGRTALQQGDVEAARAAWHQAAAHLRGRPRALGGGHLLVQALAGLARLDADPASFDEAAALFTAREPFSFMPVWICTDDVTLLELARAAAAVGRGVEAEALRARALEAGSTEARQERAG